MTTKRKTQAELERERYNRDNEMMRSPLEWPIWPLLPIKRYGKDERGFPECAALLDESREKGWVVYVLPTGVFGLVAGTPLETQAKEILPYENLDALQADGWMVD